MREAVISTVRETGRACKCLEQARRLTQEHGPHMDWAPDLNASQGEFILTHSRVALVAFALLRKYLYLI